MSDKTKAWFLFTQCGLAEGYTDYTATQDGDIVKDPTKWDMPRKQWRKKKTHRKITKLSKRRNRG